ncbi:MAG: type II toxin-antitoxin system RelE/ParE family toxin [bacterium]
MPFVVTIAPSALLELDDLPDPVQRHFKKAFTMLQENPFRPRPGLDVMKMHGGAYRVHVGRYRGMYAVQENEIVFFRFGHRSMVYR